MVGLDWLYLLELLPAKQSGWPGTLQGWRVPSFLYPFSFPSPAQGLNGGEWFGKGLQRSPGLLGGTAPLNKSLQNPVPVALLLR